MNDLFRKIGKSNSIIIFYSNIITMNDILNRSVHFWQGKVTKSLNEKPTSIDDYKYS
jgi:hypothetical protein